MTKRVTPYEDAHSGKKDQVTRMFDTISGNYDELNRVISFGVDIKWRKKVVAMVNKTQPSRVLDIATGTGDLAIAIAASNPTAKVTGLDISAGMLEVGKQKVTAAHLEDKVTMMLGDSEALPFEEHSFDAVTVAFGVRNFEDLDKGLTEIFRVLKPGGLFVVLETAVPTRFPFKQGYQLYSRYILPAIGQLFSRDKSAYSYLSKSAAVFPFGEEFNNILRKIGFSNVNDLPQTFGSASIYSASKP